MDSQLPILNLRIKNLFCKLTHLKETQLRLFLSNVAQDLTQTEHFRYKKIYFNVLPVFENISRKCISTSD